MERWRWLPRGLGKRHVMVNQAAYEMMILESGKIVDKRPVVVGKPFHKTPMFSHRIKYAEFNPTWTVPRSIIRPFPSGCGFRSVRVTVLAYAAIGHLLRTGTRR